MKSFCITLFVVITFSVTSCYPARENQYKPADLTGEITVECSKETAVQNFVKQILRSAKVGDWSYDNDGPYSIIKATYSDLPVGLAQKMEDDLSKVAGVVSIEVRRGGIVVKNVL